MSFDHLVADLGDLTADFSVLPWHPFAVGLAVVVVLVLGTRR